MKKTRFFSYKINDIAKGCKLCVKGAKLVLFVTGLCPRRCYYCPLSDDKYQKDVTYADEWPTRNIKNIIKEAELISALGAGITGGDPLVKLNRTLRYIKALKQHFGKNFHIHLYTSFNLVTETALKKLNSAGLDEIRFHPDIENEKLWHKIDIAKNFDFQVGIEIPVIPKKLKQTKKLINFFAEKIDFLNLNELEISDNSINKLNLLGYKTKNSLSYAIKGSEETAFKLLKFIEKNYKNLNVHFCTAKLKDRVQLANRIKRRAKNIAMPYDKVTREGLLLRGAIYTNKPKEIKDFLIKTYKIKPSLIGIDKKRSRVLLPIKLLKRIKEPFKKAIVEEYPTYDCLNVMTEFIK